MKAFGIIIGIMLINVFAFADETKDFQGRILDKETRNPIPFASIYDLSGNMLAISLGNGNFHIEYEQSSGIYIQVSHVAYQTDTFFIEGQTGNRIDLFLNPAEDLLSEVTVIAEKEYNDLTHLPSVEGLSINAARKNEVILPENQILNLGSNNSREIFAKVAGLTFWESDQAGLQLGIGGRGLSPNRTAYYNVRQNGYDIAADALGYPESYYNPASQAIKRIKIIRGASSLQYGPQFGGLLNFELKDGKGSNGFAPEISQTLGSFGYLNTFIGLGTENQKWTSYSYAQYSRGNGFRPNSDFESKHFHTSHAFKLKTGELKAEFTHMDYLTQQAGGLTDRQFEQDPYQSLRNRNWFSVNWNLASVKYKQKVNDSHQVEIQGFGLLANRKSLGFLGPVSRVDPDSYRSLIEGNFRNLGLEAKHRTDQEILKIKTVHITGVRVYKGWSSGAQGLGSANSDPDFTYIMNGQADQSDFDFPSHNLALFHEALLAFSPKFTATLGVRAEHLVTQSSGWYRQVNTDLAGDTILNQVIDEDLSRKRSFILGGFGLAYKPRPNQEFYFNFANNYRGITFNDLRVINPNLRIDSALSDERGFTGDLGLRHQGEFIQIDASLFALYYANRIGLIQQVDDQGRIYQYRTNVGKALSGGLEALIQIRLDKALDKSWKTEIKPFINLGITRAWYISDQASSIDQNRVEMVPEYTLRTGIEAKYKNFRTSLALSSVGKQYTDATNAEYAANATVGLVPSYQIVDFNLMGEWGSFTLNLGVNNLFNQAYFTRRATAYPGPGIIPSAPRTLNFGVKYSF